MLCSTQGAWLMLSQSCNGVAHRKHCHRSVWCMTASGSSSGEAKEAQLSQDFEEGEEPILLMFNINKIHSYYILVSQCISHL